MPKHSPPVSFVAIVQETKPFAIDLGDFGVLEGEYRPGKVNSDLLEAVTNVNPRYMDGLHRQVAEVIASWNLEGPRLDDDGEPVLDEDGQPIIIETMPVSLPVLRKLPIVFLRRLMDGLFQDGQPGEGTGSSFD